MGGFAAVLIGLGIVLAIAWAMFAAKVRKISNVPFRKPSEIAQQGVGAADAKGMVSTEGRVRANPITAPMSGKPVLYYDYEIHRHWEKQTVGSDGKPATQKGSDSFGKQKQGIVFQVADDAGGVAVDATGGVDETEKLHENDVKTMLGVVPMSLEFGGVKIQYPQVPSHDKTTKFSGVEKGIPFAPDMSVYVLGKLGQGANGLTIGGTTFGSPMVSRKSREETLGAAAKNAKFSKVAALAFVGVGLVLGIVAKVTETPEAPKAAAAATHGGTTGAATAGTQPASAPPHATPPATKKK